MSQASLTVFHQIEPFHLPILPLLLQDPHLYPQRRDRTSLHDNTATPAAHMRWLQNFPTWTCETLLITGYRNLQSFNVQGARLTLQFKVVVDTTAQRPRGLRSVRDAEA
jgi:hypothetical protein